MRPNIDLQPDPVTACHGTDTMPELPDTPADSTAPPDTTQPADRDPASGGPMPNTAPVPHGTPAPGDSERMSGIRLHNPGQFEQVIDAEGHILGGGESRDVRSLDGYAQALVERGVILASPSESILATRRKKPPVIDGDEKGVQL